MLIVKSPFAYVFRLLVTFDAHGGLRLSSSNATNSSFAIRAILPVKYSLNNYEISQTGVTMIIEIQVIFQRLDSQLAMIKKEWTLNVLYLSYHQRWV